MSSLDEWHLRKGIAIMKVIRIKSNPSIILLIATLLAMLATFTTNITLTRIISKDLFGSYSFVLNLYTFGQVVFNFGLFYAISRLIAVTDDSISIKKMYGVGLFFLLFLSSLLSIALFIYLLLGFVVDNQVYNAIFILLPFSFIFLFTSYCELLLQSSGNIKLLAFYRFVPKFIFFIFILLFYYVFNFLSLETIFYMYVLAFFLCLAYVVYKLQPIFHNLQSTVKEIVIGTKGYGFNIYIGSLVSVGASTMTGVLIGSFGVDHQEVASYTLALQFAAPLTLIPNVLGTSHFKEFAQASKISRGLLVKVYLLGFIMIAMVYLLADFMIQLFFGTTYSDVTLLLKILALGMVLYSFSDFYNKFLMSKGEGKIIRNLSFLVGGTLFVGNILLIKSYGALGASVAFVCAGAVYLFFVRLFYSRLIKKQ